MVSMPSLTASITKAARRRDVPAVCLAMIIGCSFDFPIDLVAPPNDESPVTAENDRPSGDVVTVRFNNFSAEEAIDVEFFVTTEELTSLPEQLFTEANRNTASIGIAGTGILEPLFRDIIELPCSPTLSLGTSGGRFLDNETGELRGRGQPRWVQEDALGLCGGTITFEYARDAELFVTRVLISN